MIKNMTRKTQIELQQEFMERWLEALNDPIETRVIIETTEPIKDERVCCGDNVYYMIDGSDGERLNDGSTWLFSSNDGTIGEYIQPEEVLPQALEILKKKPITAIYNDVY